jgi:hypothetical protein
MQRQILYGIPYFIDSAHKLYTWDRESAPQHIGQFNPSDKSVQFKDNHLNGLSNRLAEWRALQISRLRKATANSRANSKQQAFRDEHEENSENDE